MATRTRNVSVSGFYNPRSSRLCRDMALVLPQLHLLHCPVLLLGQTQVSPGAVWGHSSVSQGVRAQEYDHQSKVTRQQWEHPATTSNQPPVSPAVQRHALSQSSSSLDFHWGQVHQAGGSLPPHSWKSLHDLCHGSSKPGCRSCMLAGTSRLVLSTQISTTAELSL